MMSWEKMRVLHHIRTVLLSTIKGLIRPSDFSMSLSLFIPRCVCAPLCVWALCVCEFCVYAAMCFRILCLCILCLCMCSWTAIVLSRWASAVLLRRAMIKEQSSEFLADFESFVQQRNGGSSTCCHIKTTNQPCDEDAEDDNHDDIAPKWITFNTLMTFFLDFDPFLAYIPVFVRF